MTAARRVLAPGALLASGQTVRHLTLDQGIEGSNPSSPANSPTETGLPWPRRDRAVGTYHFVCNIPGHFKSGMATRVTVTP
jgi:hypothetical protein